MWFAAETADGMELVFYEKKQALFTLVIESSITWEKLRELATYLNTLKAHVEGCH